MKCLCDVVVRKDKNGYQENVHYKTFFLPETGSAWKGKITYLTFEELRRTLKTSTTPISCLYLFDIVHCQKGTP